jgi:hypothetical protein
MNKPKASRQMIKYSHGAKRSPWMNCFTLLSLIPRREAIIPRFPQTKNRKNGFFVGAKGFEPSTSPSGENMLIFYRRIIADASKA